MECRSQVGESGTAGRFITQTMKTERGRLSWELKEEKWKGNREALRDLTVVLVLAFLEGEEARIEGVEEAGANARGCSAQICAHMVDRTTG